MLYHPRYTVYSIFPKVGPIPLSYLFSSYCLALYGCELWNLSSPGLKAIEVTFNINVYVVSGVFPQERILVFSTAVLAFRVFIILFFKIPQIHPACQAFKQFLGESSV